MITDIGEILNFRHDEAYLSEEWWGKNVNLKPFEKYLKPYPKIYNYFGLVIDSSGKCIYSKRSRDVFCAVKNIDLLPEIMQDVNLRFNNLICAGDDGLLSQKINHLKKIRKNFKNIYFEAKNIECSWVRILPMGMIMPYMIRNGGNEAIINQINKKKNKNKLIASAFGSKWPELILKIKDRQELQKAAQKFNFIDDMFCQPKEYYSNLCDYKFFTAPLGNGVQTPKICECVMCETVPIVTNHIAHRELRDTYKLPLLIINRWSDLSVKFLNQQWEKTYSKIDWNKEKKKFLVNNFKQLLK